MGSFAGPGGQYNRLREGATIPGERRASLPPQEVAGVKWEHGQAISIQPTDPPAGCRASGGRCASGWLLGATANSAGSRGDNNLQR